jgi:SP family arabinose:H+ symporter-like MFS transporter
MVNMQNAEFNVVIEAKHRSFYAFFIAFVAALGGFLFGYDLVIISGAQIFIRDQFNLSEWWFGFTTTSAIIGCIFGPFLGSWFCDRIGRKRTLVFSAVLFSVSAIITAIAQDMVTFNIFRIVGGLGVGLSSIASPMYIAEVAPARIRGRLGIMYQLAIVTGAAISSIVAYLLAKNLQDTISWRWMFASEMLPILLFIGFMVFVPRSPRWLAEKGQFDEALQVLTKVESREYAEKELQGIKASLDTETGTFRELFQPGIRYALFIGICLGLFNNWTGGSAIGYYLPTIFQMGGFSEATAAIKQSIYVGAWEIMLTIITILVVDKLGRRRLWIGGSMAMIVAMFVTGLVFMLNVTGLPVLFAIFLCYAPHALALGSLPWLMMSELYPTRIRAKAVAITTTFLWVGGWACPAIFPKMVGFSERITGSAGPAFWFFCFTALISVFFGIKFLPETKGRTLEDIAKSWQKKKKTAKGKILEKVTESWQREKELTGEEEA